MGKDERVAPVEYWGIARVMVKMNIHEPRILSIMASDIEQRLKLRWWGVLE